MKKYRTRLMFGIFSLIFIVLIGLGILIGQLFKNYYTQSFDNRINKEINMIQTFIKDQGGIEFVDKEKLMSFSEMLNVRITIIDEKGELKFDSSDNDRRRDNLHFSTIDRILKEKMYKKEKKEVVEGTGNTNFHYYWTPIHHEKNKEGFLFLSTKIEELQHAFKQLWWILIFSLGGAILAILVIAFQITLRYTKPIEAATKVAIELAKGNYRARTYENRHDETEMLNVSINILARNLQKMVREQELQQNRLKTLIENMGSGLILIDDHGFISLTNRTYREVFELTEEECKGKLYYEVIKHKEVIDLIKEIFLTEEKIRKQMHLPLTIERRYFEVYGVPVLGLNSEWKGVLLVFHDITELKNLEQMRKDFVANVSHELKTPITSIKGFSETLLDGAMKDERTLEDFLNIILKESDRLQTLIQDLLDLSKIEQHGFKLNIQKINIVHLLEEVISMLEKKAKDKNISIDLIVHKEEILIEGDSYRLKQVFINLVTNAIAYSPNNGRVWIELKEKDDQVFIKVCDTGIGIAKEEIPRIFERFYRVDKARSRNSGGTGLGLAIVKHIVDVHEGTISVDSKQQVGTTFTIKLNKEFPK